jgi:hypothetical protein
MQQDEEIAIKVTKEVVIKFIEVGRLSLNSFDDAWKQVYTAVSGSLKQPDKGSD